MLALTTIFSAKIHGARAARSLRVELEPETLKLAKKLHDAGHPITDICTRLEADGHRCPKDGRKISYFVLHRHLVKEGELLEAVVPKTEELNSWQRFAKQHLVPAEAHVRLRTNDIYKAYSSWCSERGITPIKAKTVGTYLREKYEWKYTHKGYIAYCAVKLV